MHPIENVIKFVEIPLGIAVIFVWFYGYAKTREKGFALIGFAGVLRFLCSFLLWFLVTFTSLSIRDIFYTFQTLVFVVDVVSYVLIIWGIMSLIDRIRRDKT